MNPTRCRARQTAEEREPARAAMPLDALVHDLLEDELSRRIRLLDPAASPDGRDSAQARAAAAADPAARRRGEAVEDTLAALLAALAALRAPRAAPDSR